MRLIFKADRQARAREALPCCCEPRSLSATIKALTLSLATRTSAVAGTPARMRRGMLSISSARSLCRPRGARPGRGGSGDGLAVKSACTRLPGKGGGNTRASGGCGTRTAGWWRGSDGGGVHADRVGRAAAGVVDGKALEVGTVFSGMSSVAGEGAAGDGIVSGKAGSDPREPDDVVAPIAEVADLVCIGSKGSISGSMFIAACGRLGSCGGADGPSWATEGSWLGHLCCSALLDAGARGSQELVRRLGHQRLGAG